MEGTRTERNNKVVKYHTTYCRIEKGLPCDCGKENPEPFQILVFPGDLKAAVQEEARKQGKTLKQVTIEMCRRFLAEAGVKN